MLEEVFRSIIDVPKSGQATIEQKQLIGNFRSLQKSNISHEEESYKRIYHKLLDHYRQYQELPDYDLVREHFTFEEGNETVLVALDKIKTAKPRVSSNYKDLLNRVYTAQNEDAFGAILTKAHEIMSSGFTEGQGKNKKVRKGLDDAIIYLMQGSRTLQQSSNDVKLEGQIISSVEVEEVKDKYTKMKSKQTETTGIYTGLQSIDEACGGLKHTELMLAAAYVGQCKTTFCLNMLYKAVFSGWDSAMVTLEMSYEELRTMIYVLHSCNPIFLDTPFAEYVGTINVNDVIYGDLTEEQEEYFFFVIDDFKNNPDYGTLHIWQPSGSICTVSDIEAKLREFNSILIDVERKVEFCCIDYISLLGVEAEIRSKDGNENLNSIIKRLKNVCLNFNNGQGLRMLSPFQVNRTGFLEASKNDGLYNSTHLSNAHEAERSSDVIISIFMSEDMRANGTLKFCNLKNRRNPFFKPFEASINFKSRYIYDYVRDAESDFGNVTVDAEDFE